MKEIILLTLVLFFFTPVFAQVPTSRNPVKKITVPLDSAYISNERKQSLSTYRGIAIKENKNILLLPAERKKSRQHEAAFISKLDKKDLYKVDVSSLVSKYIGETEKQLSQLFEKAGSGNLTLFFDDADALFGRSGEPSVIVDRIESLAQKNNVRCIFWCEKDCLESLKKARHIVLQ